ncbi:hypothetical protein [Allobaculum sp. Allo2]
MNTNVAEIFGEKVFDDQKMRERLPKDTYRELKNDRPGPSAEP